MHDTQLVTPETYTCSVFNERPKYGMLLLNTHTWPAGTHDCCYLLFVMNFLYTLTKLGHATVRSRFRFFYLSEACFYPRQEYSGVRRFSSKINVWRRHGLCTQLRFKSLSFNGRGCLLETDRPMASAFVKSFMPATTSRTTLLHGFGGIRINLGSQQRDKSRFELTSITSQ